MKEKNFIIDNKRLIKEWNYKKNKSHNPSEISHGSIKQVWWICARGHEWQRSPNSRIKKDYISGCPYCANTKLLSGFNDLKTMNPQLAKEWNYKKNKLKSSNVLYGGATKYWWKCSKGHEWKTSIIERKANKYCPYCTNKSFKKGYNDLETMNKELLKEWDYKKNQLKPSEVKYGGNTKYWWKCSKGHEWQSSIAKRKSGGRCIYCVNHAFKTGYNDLQTMNPKLAKEWNFEKNKLKPFEVKYGGDTKYWWTCPKGHEWQTPISIRKLGNNCPYCSKSNPAVTKEESFGTLYKELLKEWDYSKNTNIDPFKIRSKVKKKAWWICPKGHEYYTQIYNRTIGKGCPICYRENQTSFPEQVVFYYMKQIFEDAQSRYKVDSVEVDIFIPSLNLGIEYDGMYFHKGKKNSAREKRKQQFLKERNILLLRIKESKTVNGITNNRVYCKYSYDHKYLKKALENLAKLINHNFSLQIKFDINLDRDRINILESYMENEKEKSIITKKPELLKEWNYEKNGNLKPEFFSYYSGKKVWWKCAKDHEWQMSPGARMNGNNCPYCSSRRVLKGFNDLGSLYPQIAKEWHPNKNGTLTAYDVMPNSNKKIWWLKKECGHEWQTTAQIRTADNSGCPYCLNRKVLKGFNDLKSSCPQIAKEWDYIKNKNIEPDQVTKGSDKKVWWKCHEGHEWQETIKIRTQTNKKCPYCSGARVVIGKNDLATTHPELLKEWDYTKNKHITPTSIKAGSEKKVWWKCEKGHEYLMNIYSKSNGYNCPYCSNKKILKGYNDLATTNPNILKEWDYDKNKTISPTKLTKGSGVKIWWLCPTYHHSYQMPVVNKINGYKCPYCSNKKVLKGFNDLATTHPELLKEWDYTKNKNISPTEITRGSSKQVWWLCSVHNNISWKTTINNRTKGTSCPQCAKEKWKTKGKKTILAERGSFKTNYPELLKEWDYEKNINLNPNELSPHTNQIAWWYCNQCDFEWQASISRRTCALTGCPRCSKEKKKANFRKSILTKRASLDITHPNILKEWDYNKNKNLSPNEVTYGSGIKVWWLCSKGHSWQDIIYKKVKGHKCPYCFGKKVLKGYNDFQSNYPELMKEWHSTKNTEIAPSTVKGCSNKMVWWQCSKGHEWQAQIRNRVGGSNCPICRKAKIN